MLQNFTPSSLMPEQKKLEHLSLQKYFALSNVLKGAKWGATVAWWKSVRKRRRNK